MRLENRAALKNDFSKLYSESSGHSPSRQLTERLCGEVLEIFSRPLDRAVLNKNIYRIMQAEMNSEVERLKAERLKAERLK